MNLPSLPFRINQYIFKQAIGSGGFGSIYLVQNMNYSNEIFFAAKMIPLNKNPQFELNVLMGLSHPNILRIFDSFVYMDKMVMILEYCDSGSLADLIDVDNNRNFLPTNFFGCFAIQAVDGLCYMHQHNIAHRDIKPQNLLLTDGNRLKIADFGLSINVLDDILERPKGMSFLYAPQELWNSHESRFYDPIKGDIWSLGITFFELIVGHLPWKGCDRDEIKKEITSALIDFDEVPDMQVRRLLFKMLNVNPENRIDIFMVKDMLLQIVARPKPRIKLIPMTHYKTQPRHNQSVPLTFSRVKFGRTSKAKNMNLERRMSITLTQPKF
ncbi:Aurora/IPL1-related protein kinase 2 [Tritrichomonas foetus]|uniref:Aurora/IPL1-related protein kinase 2 n=1 Tax=Tritrichomonas foetus TaxID=1144522 RepID=A0A1J4KRD6_9EUKA|nr:Aurora/IPL1-related protein kinase 2 [Tritrichomonas foetus]|eukprot:OHT13849.1 Aurora/IPL1-related protein kinase 2 [Tritrichomonas foetus]